MKKLLYILILLYYSNINAQCLRWDTKEESIGIQTPYNWRVYGHVDMVLFSYPFAPQIKVSAYNSQVGYVWLHGKRATMRSAVDFTVWFLSPDDDKNVYTYWGLTPIAVTLYPFDRDYLGVDLYANIDPYNINIGTGAALVVKIY
jgi:hypothetical protein